MSLELEGLSGEARGALCCATSLRIGGALYILAEAAGLESVYYRVDAGLRAGMRSYEGRSLNTAVLDDAVSAHRELTAGFPLGRPESEFFVAGLGVIELGLGSVSSDSGPDVVGEAFRKAVEAVSLWQVPSSGELQEFERACQEESVAAVLEQGASAVRKAAGQGALRYRKAAQEALSRGA